MQRSDITGFVLAGGLSRRMGQDKATISWGSGTLLSHAIAVLQTIVAEVLVVGRGSTSEFDVPAIPDELPGQGPLSGIQTALLRSSTEWNLVLALDLPLVTAEWLQFIAEVATVTSALAVVAECGGRLQPLCGAYRRGLLTHVDKAVKDHELSIQRLLQTLAGGKIGDKGSIEVLKEEKLIAGGFRAEMFTNVNTPEQLEQARKLAEELHVNDY